MEVKAFPRGQSWLVGRTMEPLESRTQYRRQRGVFPCERRISSAPSCRGTSSSWLYVYIHATSLIRSVCRGEFCPSNHLRDEILIDLSPHRPLLGIFQTPPSNTSNDLRGEINQNKLRGEMHCFRGEFPPSYTPYPVLSPQVHRAPPQIQLEWMARRLVHLPYGGRHV
jgi:hypothetical protein